MIRRTHRWLIGWGLALAAGSMPALGLVPTAFTYQGQLKLAGTPVNGTVDLSVKLYDGPEGLGSGLASTQVNNVTLVDGLFTVDLDFGGGVFDGNDRWIGIAVRSPHDPTDSLPFTDLSPWQQLKATPYAMLRTTGPITCTWVRPFKVSR